MEAIESNNICDYCIKNEFCRNVPTNKCFEGIKLLKATPNKEAVTCAGCGKNMDAEKMFCEECR